jgi:hypothetical protein
MPGNIWLILSRVGKKTLNQARRKRAREFGKAKRRERIYDRQT